MKVYKFGGASVANVERIRNLEIVLRGTQGPLLIVISAMGKTTNALEEVVRAFFAGNKDVALQLFQKIKSDHLEVEESLMLGQPDYRSVLGDFFTEIEWLLYDKPVRDFDYYYDQVVCVGELLSSAIVSSYLNKIGFANEWVDVRDIIRTDSNFRDAKIDWENTALKMSTVIEPKMVKGAIVITQGFIGATDDNESTTLGREGSDYSAAVFANLLNAESQTIWKDVQGVMNADPKQYEKATWIKELNYREVIEMAYYGAQVIHPKTIKPLQNKNIPLYVRSFVNPEAEGTCIHNNLVNDLPPIIVHKHRQVLVELRSRDFSFVSDELTTKLYEIFETIKFRPNLTQNAAITLLCVVDEHEEKVEQLASAAAQIFDVFLTRSLTLLTIRHYDHEIVEELRNGRKIILLQQTPETIQLLVPAV